MQQSIPENALVPTDNPEQLIANQENSIIGTVFHRCCEYLAQQENPALPETITSFIQHLLAQHGIVEETASAKVHTLLQNTINDKTGRWILSPHSHSQQEWRITQQIANDISLSVIDRCFIDQNIFWIVDYKTNAPEPDETEATFMQRMTKTYTPQLLHYKKLAQPLTDLPIALMLYCPALPMAITLENRTVP